MLLISNITIQPITKYKINDTLFDQLKKNILEIKLQKGFQNRNLTRLYVGNMFSMNFDS